ncbi:MAG: hypothetical protein AAFX87_15405 [Bacteroidota bacterium]
MKLGIIVPLPQELKTITKQKLSAGACAVVNSTHHVCLSGMGEERVKKACQKLSDLNVDALISWGSAAAISSGLKAGDLVIPKNVIDQQGDVMRTSVQLGEGFTTLIKQSPIAVSHGMIAESTLLTTPEEKSQLYQQTDAVAADMESGIIARFAQASNMPFACIRSISDDAQSTVPRIISESIGSNGMVNIAKLMWKMISHPGQITGLRKLAISFKETSKTLSEVGRKLEELRLT